MSTRHRKKPIDEEMKNIMLNIYKMQYDTEEEAIDAFKSHLDGTENALKVYSHVYLEESEFSKEDFIALPKPILNLISWMVQEIDEMDTFKENVEAWIEERPI